MNRREFLRYSAMLTAASAFPSLSGCGDEDTTDRYRPRCTKDTILLTNASIIDVYTGKVRSENRILIKDGRIRALLTGQESGIFRDCELDLEGAYVTPGLINAHCHISIPCTFSLLRKDTMEALPRQIERNAEECIRHGVTTVRDMLAVSNWVQGVKEKIARGDLVGPRILTSFAIEIFGGYFWLLGVLAGDERYHKMANTPQQAVNAVNAAIEHGADLIKISQEDESRAQFYPAPSKMNLEIMAAICGEAARHDIPVAVHNFGTEGLRKGLDAGVTSMEHVFLDRELTAEEIARTLDKNIWIVPTVSAGFACSWETNRDPEWDEGNKAMVKEERGRLLPNLIPEYCEPAIAASLLEDFSRYSDPDSFDQPHLTDVRMESFRTYLTHGISNVQTLYDAGARFGCGNDGGLIFVAPGAIGLEMYLLQKFGMDTASILRMATLHNAQLLGLENEIGSIEKGKVADLAVFRKDPLDTFENAFNPVMVFQGGRLVFSS